MAERLTMSFTSDQSELCTNDKDHNQSKESLKSKATFACIGENFVKCAQIKISILCPNGDVVIPDVGSWISEFRGSTLEAPLSILLIHCTVPLTANNYATCAKFSIQNTYH